MPELSRWASDAEKFKAMQGKTVLRVEVPNDHTAYLVLNDGSQWSFEVEGDCCSNSFFADNNEWQELDGATIQSVETRRGGSKRDGEYDHLQWDFLVFITNKGHTTIQHNNSSNGYYSGYWTITREE